MGKNSFQFARIVSPEEAAEYLSSLAVGLKRGEVGLESGERSLRLSPPSELKLELQVTRKEHKGRIVVEVGWKRSTATRMNELRVVTAARAARA
jgi:amphi-Trp domain-containing protein